MRRLIVAVATLTLLSAPPAMAWTVNDVIRDCSQNGKLTHDYPPSLVRKARNSLPADIDEYTDCRDLLAAPSGGDSSSSAGGGGPANGGTGADGGGASASGGGGGSARSGSSVADTPPSPAELKALDAARTGTGTGTEAVDIGGTPIVPGAAGMTTGAVDNALPSTLLIVLILLALAIAAAGGPLLRRRIASGRRPGSALRRVLARHTH